MLFLFNYQLGFAGSPLGETARKRPEKRPSGHAITAEARARDRRRAIEADDEELMLMAAGLVAMLRSRGMI